MATPAIIHEADDINRKCRLCKRLVIIATILQGVALLSTFLKIGNDNPPVIMFISGGIAFCLLVAIAYYLTTLTKSIFGSSGLVQIGIVLGLILFYILPGPALAIVYGINAMIQKKLRRQTSRKQFVSLLSEELRTMRAGLGRAPSAHVIADGKQNRLLRIAQMYIPNEQLTVAGLCFWAVVDRQDTSSRAAGIGGLHGGLIGGLIVGAITQAVVALNARYKAEAGIIAVGERSVFIMGLGPTPLAECTGGGLSLPDAVVEALYTASETKQSNNHLMPNMSDIGITPIAIDEGNTLAITMLAGEQNVHPALAGMHIVSRCDLPDIHQLAEAIRGIISFPTADEVFEVLSYPVTMSNLGLRRFVEKAMMSKEFADYVLVKIMEKPNYKMFFKACRKVNGNVRASFIAFLKRRGSFSYDLQRPGMWFFYLFSAVFCGMGVMLFILLVNKWHEHRDNGTVFLVATGVLAISLALFWVSQRERLWARRELKAFMHGQP